MHHILVKKKRSFSKLVFGLPLNNSSRVPDQSIVEHAGLQSSCTFFKVTCSYQDNRLTFHFFNCVLKVIYI